MVNLCLSNVFEQRRLDPSPCVAQVDITARESIGGSPYSGYAYACTSETKFLAYRDAWLVLKEHEIWIQNTIQDIFISLQTQQTPQAQHDKEHPDIHADVDIVLAYITSNSTDAMMSILAAADNVQAQVALLNTRWTPKEMADALQCTSSKGFTVVFYTNEDESRDKAMQIKAMLHTHQVKLVHIPVYSQNYFVNRSTISPEEDHPSNEEIDDQIRRVSAYPAVDALLVFTSGTTTGSKGVRLSHRALWIQALAKLRDPCGYNRTTRMLSTTVPIFHVGGLNSTLALWLAGGTWMIPHDGVTQGRSGFDANVLLGMISHPCVPTNTLVVVPAMLHSILQRQQQQQQDHQVYPQVKLVLIGGQSASQDMLDKLLSIFPRARIVQTYACTEAASSLTFHEPTKDLVVPDRRPILLGDCVGRPPPHVQLQLVEQGDAATIIAEPYKVGVLVTSGPHVMSGYWNRNVHPSSPPPPSPPPPPLIVLEHQKILRHVTNDLGFRDDEGRYYFCGRCNDVIRTGGETVLALEVERILLQHPLIDECAVFGLVDERLGETVCAAIVLTFSSSGTLLSLDDIRQHCQNFYLAGYKRPRRIYTLSELPRNSSGKVLKFQLVEMFQNPRITSRL